VVPRLLLCVLILAAAACSDRAAEEPAAEESAAPADAVFDMRNVHFAPELAVSLDAMTRTDDGIYIADVREGRGRAAEFGSSITVEYRAWLPDGTLFEQRPSAEGFGLSEFVLGENAPVAGLNSGIAGMRTGGIRRIALPPEHGYGLVGRPAGVPAETPLLFEVRLMNVRD
jgi:FKBP-type peptidyl-prolyl cis-trans isomerase FkpA